MIRYDMPLYTYEAVDSSGRKTRQTLSSTDEETLKATLAGMGLIPLSIKVAEAKAATLFQRVSSKDLLAFTQELGNLLDAGMPIDRALFVLSEYTHNRSLRAIVKEISIDIQKGATLSFAMGKHRVFPRLYINMIRAGEAGGILETVIKRLTVFLETTISFREDIISALIYPMLLTVVGGLAIAVLLLYVIPSFAQVFSDMGQALPLPTLVLIRISEFFARYWWAVFGCAAAVFFLLRSYARTAEGKNAFDQIKLSVPVLKQLSMRFIIARFARTLGTLLQSGVPILEALRVSRDVIDNDIVARKLAALEEGVSKGKGVSAPLREAGVFPPLVSQMVTVGEEAGKLEDTFLLIAERYEADTRSFIRRFVSLFEPALILVMGLIVGLIVISMLIGIFSINEIPM